MKKILILGASILQLPAIRKAKELGYYVGVVDYNPNAVGISEADAFYNVSTIDVDGVVKIARSFSPDGIMTLATDMPMRSVAAACKDLGLRGISQDTALMATDKGEMIKAFESNNVEHPWYFVIDSKKDFLRIKKDIIYPCIMKPTDNAGSRGVVLCYNYEDLQKQYDYSHSESRGGSVIVEEYLQGPEFSIEVMVVNEEPYVLQITDKLTTGAPHFVEMGHSQPSMQPEENIERIKNLAIRAVKAVGINVGPAHVEIILTKDGPKMVELGARMGGDCITTHLVPLSTGIDMVGCAIKIACGEAIDLRQRINMGSAIRYFDSCNGIIKRIEGIEKVKRIPGVKEVSVVHQVGETIGNFKSSSDRIGFVIAQGKTAKEAISICEKAKKIINIEVK